MSCKFLMDGHRVACPASSCAAAQQSPVVTVVSNGNQEKRQIAVAVCSYASDFEHLGLPVRHGDRQTDTKMCTAWTARLPVPVAQAQTVLRAKS